MNTDVEESIASKQRTFDSTQVQEVATPRLAAELKDSHAVSLVF